MPSEGGRGDAPHEQLHSAQNSQIQVPFPLRAATVRDALPQLLPNSTNKQTDREGENATPSPNSTDSSHRPQHHPPPLDDLIRFRK